MMMALARVAFFLCLVTYPVSGQPGGGGSPPSPCSSGQPTCSNGQSPAGRPPSCADGSTPTCPDGSTPTAPPGGGGGGTTGDTNTPPTGGGGGGNTPASSSPHAASMLGDIGRTTVTGTVPRTNVQLPIGENIYGPFEAGFSSQQDNIIRGLGCTDPSKGYVQGGIDTNTADQVIAQGCGIVLPRVENGQWIGLLDECGGHTNEYHFHEKLSCLYDGTAPGHSTKVGETTGGQPMYGKWEDTLNQELPLLDACGGHFGRTPESPSVDVYHYHVQDNAPFTIGCIGPNDDNSLVTVSQCRAFYTGCDANLVTLNTPTGAVQYDDWCPCYDDQKLNSGVAIKEKTAFRVSRGTLLLSLPSGFNACASSFRAALKESVAAGANQVSGGSYAAADIVSLTVAGCGAGSSRRLQASGVEVSFAVRAADPSVATQLSAATSANAGAFTNALAASLQSGAASVTATATFAGSTSGSPAPAGGSSTAAPTAPPTVPGGTAPAPAPSSPCNNGAQPVCGDGSTANPPGQGQPCSDGRPPTCADGTVLSPPTQAPTSQPGQTSPTSQPTGPTSQPTGPTSQPTGPTSQPTGPTSQPTGPTSQPTGPTSQPTGPTSQPGSQTGTTRQPGQTGTGPTCSDGSRPACSDGQPPSPSESGGRPTCSNGATPQCADGSQPSAPSGTSQPGSGTSQPGSQTGPTSQPGQTGQTGTGPTSQPGSGSQTGTSQPTGSQPDGPTCADGSRPVCSDGNKPSPSADNAPTCGDGSTAACGDGSTPFQAGSTGTSQPTGQTGQTGSQGSGEDGPAACADGSKPACSDGQQPTAAADGQKPQCSNGQPPQCATGTGGGNTGTSGAPSPAGSGPGGSSPCADGSRPTCDNGETIMRGIAMCSDNSRPKCADGSMAARPTTNTNRTGTGGTGGGAGGNRTGTGGNRPEGGPGGGGGGGNTPRSTSRHAASMLGDVGKTTVTGTVPRSNEQLPVGENIYGPFEAGFGAQQANIFTAMGCANPEKGYVVGGIDTSTAEQVMAYGCNITLPREEDGKWISLLDECGGHTQEYHFHEKLSCLYDGTKGGHSAKVGETNGGQSLYGKWEHTRRQQLPLLDACGGHWGRTPENPRRDVYHYHVQDSPPFTIGCIGPNDDGSLVTVQQCRDFYTGCDGDLLTLTTKAKGTFQYDAWCPCYDAKASNTGIEISELLAFRSSKGSFDMDVPAGTDTCADNFKKGLKRSVVAACNKVAKRGKKFTEDDIVGLSVGGCEEERRRRLRALSSNSVTVDYTVKTEDAASASELTDSAKTDSSSFTSAFTESVQTETGVAVTAVYVPPPTTTTITVTTTTTEATTTTKQANTPANGGNSGNGGTEAPVVPGPTVAATTTAVETVGSGAAALRALLPVALALLAAARH